MTEIEIWACNYVSQKDPEFAALPDDKKLTENLFTSGRLDSIGLMNFLLDAETEFGFQFTPESFQDRRLQTISGLDQVVVEIRKVA
ncbi:acyl carrier protein [Pelagibius litoralis]|uniref:Acyl carrier protein n=1 Tax=Pelagibius litoralis TaxID=374515 RepID=A0A967K8Z1_9PROT|nr:phosphopantetheine-binding protein [Pelagibius litoralis]NIA69552.1 acyl carrier protein [Pelagibius litoralis]